MYSHSPLKQAGVAHTKEDVQTFVCDLLPSTKEGQSNYGKKVEYQTLPLNNSRGGDMKRQDYAKRELKIKTRSRRNNKARDGLFEVGVRKQKKNAVQFESFLPLHKLWCQYMLDVLGTSTSNPNPRKLQDAELILAKADLHGAHIEVKKTKNPSFLGLQGIVLQESYHTFSIVTRDNRVCVLPKKNNVFELSIDSDEECVLFSIYGNHFCMRPAERSVKKFKSRPTIEL